METVLATGDGEATFLRSALAASAIERGLVLDGDKIYDFTKPPVLGGAVDLGNLSMIDFVVGINIAGQIHDQLRDRARGTPVAGVTISKDEPTKRRGHWRR